MIFTFLDNNARQEDRSTEIGSTLEQRHRSAFVFLLVGVETVPAVGIEVVVARR